MNKQIPLSIQLNDEATLEDFNWGDNQILKSHLTSFLTEQNQPQFLYIWGDSGCGKSHLLQACCQAIANQSAIYLSLQTLVHFTPDILEGLEVHMLICIDDLETITGLQPWEEGLFHLFNRIRDNQRSKLIMTGKMAPTNMPIKLADLKSRLCWGTVFHLHELSDDNKIETLQRHAQKRGFEIPTPVGQFLINRCARNMHDLHTLLNQLDETSLAAQRKITIPFVKQALDL
jgi:DnaA family protein